MNKTIDCLFIGHNEMDFSDNETQLREMSARSGAYRDLNLNFIRYNNKLYTASDIFNLFYLNGNENPWNSDKKPLNVGDTFSAAIRTSISCPFGCSFCGFPGETDGTVQDTIRFIKEAGAETIKQIKQPFQGVVEPVNTNEESIKDKYEVTFNF